MQGIAAGLDATVRALPWQQAGSERLRLCAPERAALEQMVTAALAGHPRGTGPIYFGRRPEDRVIKGGSWGSDSRVVYASYRAGQREDQRSPFLGFRCARDRR
jgi:hypothetical protein